MGEMLRKLSLEEASKIEGSEECLVRSTNCEQAAGVNGFEANGKLLGCCGDHARKKETGKIVGDDHAGVPGEGCEEPLAGPGCRFNVRIVANAARPAHESVVGHAVKDETVKAIAGPRVGDAERFKNEKRLGKRSAMLERAIECEVGMKAATGDHPIEDVIGGVPHGRFVAAADADGGNSCQNELSWRKTAPRLRSLWRR